MFSRIRERLKFYNAKRVECASTILAGVVIPLLQMDGEVFILLTKRSDSVRFHKGEISFPGGMYEEKDGEILQTALRECCEEIGVKKGDVEVVGRLDDLYTLTGFVITPYVGIIPYPYQFHTSPGEVAYIVMLPYRHLKEAEPVLEMVALNGKTYKAHSIYYKGDRIWGATCRMLLQFKKLIEDEET